MAIMYRIVPCLWFDSQAEEAAAFYTSVFPNSRIGGIDNVHHKNSWEDETMWKDSIVEDVRKVREEHAAEFNYNLDTIYQDLKKQQKRSGRKVVSLPAKRAAVAVRANWEE